MWLCVERIYQTISDVLLFTGLPCSALCFLIWLICMIVAISDSSEIRSCERLWIPLIGSTFFLMTCSGKSRFNKSANKFLSFLQCMFHANFHTPLLIEFSLALRLFNTSRICSTLHGLNPSTLMEIQPAIHRM